MFFAKIASTSEIMDVLALQWQPRPLYGWPGDDPTKAPSDGWVWKGEGAPGSREGNWKNPNTSESLHSGLEHDAPNGPHWD
jgi:hypothetical protein